MMAKYNGFLSAGIGSEHGKAGVKRDTPYTNKEYREGVMCALSLLLYCAWEKLPLRHSQPER